MAYSLPRCGVVMIAVVALSGSSWSVSAEDSLGVRVPDGFEITEFATDELAHDVFCLTVDSLGRVVVSGPGYVRILIDENGDGQADRVQQFADGPRTGAQGMLFHGRDLLCIGDAGLLRYRDRNGDDRADGPPEMFLKCKTGGEHDVHSVQHGPDGWWYLIAGNMAGIDASYATLPTSPIKEPNQGVLMRLKPDLSGGEILTDGLRNSYDFAFNPQGDVFTFDSDDERDISLPWYRPTRVFHLLPGANAGYFSRSWKRPDDYPEMPPVLASFGRGSPTGVVCYRHTRFPEKYRNGLFVLDWTYGRVLALPLKRAGETWRAEPDLFMQGVGEYGFAPTDAEVGPDGSLYVSVGGRGTRGGVYRIRARQSVAAENPRDALTACLSISQPLSSWSRAVWMPLAKELGKEPFLVAVRDDSRPPWERVRAIEILTELFGGVDAAALRLLSQVSVPEVRARAVWSYGRVHGEDVQPDVLAPFLSDRDPLVARAALEALLPVSHQANLQPLVPGLAQRLGSPERFNRMAAIRLIPKLDDAGLVNLARATTDAGSQAVVSYAFGWITRTDDAERRIRSSVPETALRILEGQYPPDLKFQAARLLQVALGDVGPAEKLPAVFNGYHSRFDLSGFERELDPIRVRVANLYPTGHARLDAELGRVVAMLTPFNDKLLDRVLAAVTADSDPVADIHQLIVAARIPVPRSARQRQKTAEALVVLEPKVLARKLPQDTNWDDRVAELYTQLAQVDPELPGVIVRQPSFGRPGHVMYLSQLPPEHLPTAMAAFKRAIADDPHYPWTNEVVFVLGESKDPADRELVRRQFDRFAVRGAVLMTLAQHPDEIDRERFVQGLESSQVEVLTACVEALEKLPTNRQPDEQIALFRTLRRLGADNREYVLRDKVAALLRRNTGQEFGFVFGKAGHHPQPEVMRRWETWLRATWPNEAATGLGGHDADLAQLRTLLEQVNWESGDPRRGEKVFETRSCGQCHGRRTALGPDLSGVAGRFSREDLFTAIVLPSRDVSPRYQTTMIQTTDGKTYTGLVVYESVDGLILRNATSQTFRIESSQIEERRQLNSSLMPNGLLKDLSPQDLADLYAYLRSLGAAASTAGS